MSALDSHLLTLSDDEDDSNEGSLRSPISTERPFVPPLDVLVGLTHPYLKGIEKGIRHRLLHSTRHVVMGGGAMYGIMYIGALMALVKNSPSLYARWIAQVTDVAGTSAGALVGFMTAAGWDPWQMRECVHRSGLERLVSGLMDIDASQIKHMKALSSGKAADETIQEVVCAVTGRATTTFQEFYVRVRRKFVVVVTNGSTNMTEYWSYKNKPDMPVWKALRCTSSVPGLFASPIIDGGSIYDGGLTCNIPCHLFPRDKTLTLFVHGRPPSNPANIRTMLLQLMTLYTCAAQLGPMRTAPILAFRSIPCAPRPETKVGHLGPFSFDAPPEVIDGLIADGWRCTQSVFTRDLLLCGLIVIEVVNVH